MKHLKTFEDFINEAVSVDTIRYKRSHGKEPRGTGMWAFYFDKAGENPFFTPSAMSYQDAVKWAKEQAKEAGKNIIYVGESLNEATSDTILYKVHFKPEYSIEDDSTNTPIKPVFVQMNTGERTKIANYAAVEKIGGYGKTTPDMLLAKDRIDTKEMSFAELFKMIKSLHRIKIQR